jgi:hypothetical protein
LVRVFCAALNNTDDDLMFRCHEQLESVLRSLSMQPESTAKHIPDPSVEEVGVNTSGFTVDQRMCSLVAACSSAVAYVDALNG